MWCEIIGWNNTFGRAYYSSVSIRATKFFKRIRTFFFSFLDIRWTGGTLWANIRRTRPGIQCDFTPKIDGGRLCQQRWKHLDRLTGSYLESFGIRGRWTVRRMAWKEIGHRVSQCSSRCWLVVHSIVEERAYVVRWQIHQWNRHGHGEWPVSLRQWGNLSI